MATSIDRDDEGMSNAAGPAPVRGGNGTADCGVLALIEGRHADDSAALDLLEVRVFEFAVPKSTTQGGKAEVVLRSEPGAFPVVGLNAIWLMKRDKMPWSAEEALD